MGLVRVALLGLFCLTCLISQAKSAVPLPKEMGRFDLPHAAFIEVYENSNEGADPLDRLTLFISTFNPGRFKQKLEVLA